MTEQRPEGRAAIIDPLARHLLTSAYPELDWNTLDERTRDRWRARAVAALEVIDAHSATTGTDSRPQPTDLTTRQAAVLYAIDSWIGSHGYAPSMREIANLAGLSSPSSVMPHLRALADKGYLRRRAGVPRALELSYRAAL